MSVETKSRLEGGAINHLRARVEILCSERGWSFRDLGARMKRSYQGIVGALNREAHNTKTRQRFVADLAEAFGVESVEVLRPVRTAEYGVALIPRYNKESKR